MDNQHEERPPDIRRLFVCAWRTRDSQWRTRVSFPFPQMGRTSLRSIRLLLFVTSMGWFCSRLSVYHKKDGDAGRNLNTD